jgi:hypothetical protein
MLASTESILQLARYASLSLLVALVGCDKDICARKADNIAVAVLDGLEPYYRLDRDSVLPIHWGAQGGFHLFLAVEASGIQPGASDLATGLAHGNLPTVHWEVLAPDGRLSTERPRRVLAEAANDGWFLGPHRVVLQYYETTPAEAFDADARQVELEQSDIELSVTVDDMCGVQARSSAVVRVAFQEPSGR